MSKRKVTLAIMSFVITILVMAIPNAVKANTP